jgi:hypothetical protein
VPGGGASCVGAAAAPEASCGMRDAQLALRSENAQPPFAVSAHVIVASLLSRPALIFRRLRSLAAGMTSFAVSLALLLRTLGSFSFRHRWRSSGASTLI